jgi:hypothetical protein
MTDREVTKAQADKLFDLVMLKKAPPEKREEVLENQILRVKASMAAEEISHVMAMAEATKL